MTSDLHMVWFVKPTSKVNTSRHIFERFTVYKRDISEYIKGLTSFA